MCLLGSNLISEWAGLSFFDFVSSFWCWIPFLRGKMSRRRVCQLLSLVSGAQNEWKSAQMEIEISNEVSADSSTRPLLLQTI